MWKALGEGILRYKIILLLILLAATAFMGWHASKVKLSYEFSRAIPTDNPKYLAYQEFRKKYGEDGNLLVIGIQSKDIFQQTLFNDYTKLHEDLKKVPGVDDVISLPSAVNLVKDSATEKLEAKNIFTGITTQEQIDSVKNIFYSLPFYRGLLYNPETSAWLMGVRVNKDVLNSEKRNEVVKRISQLANEFGAKNKLDVHLSGLPLIRTIMASRIANEARWFTIGSVLLSALILLLFFRSFSAMLLSLAVVVI